MNTASSVELLDFILKQDLEIRDQIIGKLHFPCRERLSGGGRGDATRRERESLR